MNIKQFGVLTVFVAAGLAGGLRAEESQELRFLSADEVLNSRTLVSDIDSFTCGSAPISCVDEESGVIYAPYLASRSGYGEQHDIVALATIPNNAPETAESTILVEKGIAVLGQTFSSVIDPASIRYGELVRTYFLGSASAYRYIDYDPDSKTAVEMGAVLCTWGDGTVTNDLARAAVQSYLSSKGMTGYNLGADAGEPVIFTSKPVWIDGDFYGFVTSGLAQPILFRCRDGKTFEFLGVVPVLGKYEAQLACLNGRFYALVRAVASPQANFWYSDDEGATWSAITRLPMAETRPQLLAYGGKLLVAYSENNVSPNLIRQGRNNMVILSGAGTEIADYTQVFSLVDPYGFVYFDLVPMDDSLYCLWSNSSIHPNAPNNPLQGKDALFFARLASVASGGDGEELLKVSYADGSVTIIAATNNAVIGTKSILLRFGLTEGDEYGLGWEHAVLVTDELTSTGGVWTVDADACGLTEGNLMQAVAGKVIGQYEYIESDGSHYFDTGIRHTQEDAVQLDFMLNIDSAGSINWELYGARDDGSGTKSVELFTDPHTAGKMIADFRNSSSSQYRMAYTCPSGSQCAYLCRKRLTATLDSSGARISSADGAISASAQSGYASNFELSHSAWVFGVNNAGWARVPNMRLYSLSITRGNEPFRNYIASKDANGLPCLRDVISSTSPLTSAGNDFTLGDFVQNVVLKADQVAVSPLAAASGRVVATVEDFYGFRDGEAHMPGFDVTYPAAGEGCLVQWAWTDCPSEQDFVHEEPCGYVEPGVYTNVVRVIDLTHTLGTLVATGVVEIVEPLTLERRAGGILGITLAPGFVTGTVPLTLAWGLADAGGDLAAWEHLITVEAAVTAAGGDFEVDLAAAGVPEVAYCRAFAVKAIQALDYLEADGEHYLDTGISHQSGDQIDLRLSIKGLPTSVNSGIYGSRDGNGANEVSVLAAHPANASGRQILLDFWNSSSINDRLTAEFDGEYSDIFGKVLHLCLSRDAIYLDAEDGTYGSIRKKTATTITCSKTAYVFGCNENWMNPRAACAEGVRLYEITIARNGRPYCHYLPALDPDSGVACLYDTVNNAYLVNTAASFGGAETQHLLPLSDSARASSQTLLTADDLTAVQAVTEGARGRVGEQAYQASVRVVYPSNGEGCLVRWAWTGEPSDGDFVHEEAARYASSGVYTNIVRVTDASGVLSPYFGTGVVEVVRAVTAEMTGAGDELLVTVAPDIVQAGMPAQLFLVWGAADRGSAFGDWEHSRLLTGKLTSEGIEMRVPTGELEGGFGPFYRAIVVGIERLEYLESTGSEYIDLGRALTDQDRVRLEVEFAAKPTGDFGLFGARNTYNKQCYVVSANSSSVSINVNNCGNNNYGNMTAKDSSLTLNARYVITGGGSDKAQVKECVGATTNVVTASTANSVSFTTPGNARLFDIYEQTDGTFNPSAGRVRICSCVINDGEAGTGMNLVPVRMPDGTLGMWDLTTAVLYDNDSGSGAFTAPTTGIVPLTAYSPLGSTAGKVMATMTDFKGFYDGEAHTVGIVIDYPGFGEGCVMKWAWNGHPREQDFTHDEPGSYVKPGFYTNVVRIVDAVGTLAPFVGTGAVEIVRAAEVKSAGGAREIYAKVQPRVVPEGTTARLVLLWDSADRGERAADWAHWAVLDDAVTSAGIAVRQECEQLGIGKGDVFKVMVVRKDYERLEYLESTKLEYIEFPRKLHNADSVVLEASFPEVPTGNFGVFGARNNYDDAAYGISANATAVTFDINSDGSAGNAYLNYRASLDHAANANARYVFTGGNGVKATIAEILGATTNQAVAASATAKSFETTPSMRLFDVAEQTGDVFSPARGKVRVHSLLLNGGRPEEGMDLIPVQRSYGALGMYDRTSGTFYGNSSGSGSFVAGPVIGFDPGVRCSVLAASLAKVLRGPGMIIIIK